MRKSPVHPAKNAVPAALFLVGALAAGCGGAVAGGGAKAGDTPAMEQESSLSELDRAEGEINALFGPRSSPADPAASAAPTAPPPAPPAVQPQEARAADAKGEALAGGDACGVACRALASMTRAADHFCGISGEGDTRCSAARERVKSATERVSEHCTCDR
jgi:hypothetical protein